MSAIDPRIAMPSVLLYLALATMGGLPAGTREALSLEAALARANAANPDLLALRERVNATASREEAIAKQNRPRVGLEVDAQRTDNPAAAFASKLNAARFEAADFDLDRINAPGAVSHVTSALVIEMPIDLFDRIGLAARVQGATRKALSETAREAEFDIAFQVTEAYLGAVLACRAVLTTERAVVAARSREEVTQARFAEGVALQSDVLRVRARRRAREADLASQRSALEVSEAALGRLIGAPDGARFYLTDPLEPVESARSLEEWKSLAAAARPLLGAARGMRDAATLSARFERTSSRPQLAAAARVMDHRASRGGGQSWAVGVGLRWDLRDASRDKRIAAALADERAAVEDQRAARDRVRFEIEAAFSRVVAARERRAAAEGGAQEGREALRVIQERRAQGLATLTDELETEAAAFVAELEEIHAARGAVLAEAALRRAAGVNPASTIQ